MHKPSSFPRRQQITTIGAVISQQSIVPDWMRNIQVTYGDKACVSAEYIDTAFGTYCVGAEPMAEMVFRQVYGGEKKVVRVMDTDMRSLRTLAVTLRDITEDTEGGEWYCSSIVRSNGTDFEVFPHPEDWRVKGEDIPEPQQVTDSLWAEPMYPTDSQEVK
jgi:hypothetical protein